jgi:hypothetical protein
MADVYFYSNSGRFCFIFAVVNFCIREWAQIQIIIIKRPRNQKHNTGGFLFVPGGKIPRRVNRRCLEINKISIRW